MHGWRYLMSLPRIFRWALKFQANQCIPGPPASAWEAQMWNLLLDVPGFIKPRYFRDVDPRDYDA